MKRFFTLMMTVIIMGIMLTTTAYAAEDAVRMVFDEHAIKMIAQEDTIVTLQIDISLGNINESISKEIELTEKTTTTLNVDDLVFEYFSDFYKDSDAKIVNVMLESSLSVEQEENGLKALIFIGIIAVFGAISVIACYMICDYEKSEKAAYAIIGVGIIIAIAYAILA